MTESEITRMTNAFRKGYLTKALVEHPDLIDVVIKLHLMDIG